MTDSLYYVYLYVKLNRNPKLMVVFEKCFKTWLFGGWTLNWWFVMYLVSPYYSTVCCSIVATWAWCWI